MLHFVRSNIKRVLVQGINTVLMLTLSFSSFIYVLTPRVALADTTFSLYAQTSKNTYSNFNDTSVNQTYAWQWTPTTSGVPTQLTLSIDHVTGTPTGSVCIRADKTAASASFGCASNVTFTAGDNVLTIANGVALTAGTSYWAYFTRTSDASNYPSIQYKYPTAGAAMYRSLADNTDPTGLWFNYDIAMSITGAASTAAAASAPVTLYSQTTGGTYSYFAYRGADERFAWQWKPVVSGTPTQLTLFTELVQGTPTGSVCIRADRKIASQSFGCANNVTFKAGQNDLTLTGAAPVIAGTTYWIYYVRTSGGTWQDNFAAFQYKYPTAGTFTAYRSSTLGADPSDADYWFTYDMKMVVTGMSDAASTPVTPPAPAPVAPTSQPIISTLTLYDQAQRGTYSNFNWNGAGDNYAWKWAPISNGIPNRIHLWTDHVTGTPTGDICIRATQSTASASYGCATNVTLKAGENIIPLTGGQAVSWEGGNTYFVHFTRTSDANNYPSFQYRYPQTNYPLYRSSVAGGEPTTLWFNYDIAMSIENVQYAPAPSTVTLAPLVIYSQDTHNTYSNFNDNSSGEEYAWQWEPQADGIPSQLLISLERTMGNPSGSFCIREHKERNSASFGCTGPVTFTAGQNIFPLTGTAPVYKTGVYYVHFNRTSSALDYPSIQYQTVGGKYAVYRSTTATGDPDNNWFTADIAMTIRGTNLTTPAPVSNLIYGLSPDQALALYNKLGSVDRTVTTGGTAIELGIIDNAASLAGAGRSTVIAPTISAIQAKEFPQYYYPYRYLIPEYSKSVIVGDTPIDSYVEYDQLGAALGKAPTMPVAPAPVDKTGYIYGMPRAEADAIYQLMKSGAVGAPYFIDAGNSGVYPEGALWEIGTHRISSGLYRYQVGQVTGNQTGWQLWTKAYAESHGYKDYSLEQAKAAAALPYHFLAPGFTAALSTTSGTSGISSVISFAPISVDYAIPFTQLESALGYPPSGVVTPNLVYNAPPVAGLAPLIYPTTPTAITTIPVPHTPILPFSPTTATIQRASNDPRIQDAFQGNKFRFINFVLGFLNP